MSCFLLNSSSGIILPLVEPQWGHLLVSLGSGETWLQLKQLKYGDIFYPFKIRRHYNANI